MSSKTGVRDSFTGRFGIIAAAAGSAIGLGNIWKFPYITGEYGGAAFILIYLLCIAGIGLPILLAEFMLGRWAQKNVVGALKQEAPGTKWYYVGGLGILIAFILLAFYSVVAGWTLQYTWLAATNAFSGLSAEELGTQFGSFISNPWAPLFWQSLFMALTVFVVLGGIKNGIERYSRILMPLLVVLLVILAVRSLSLPGAEAGVAFLLEPDFSKLNQQAVVAALGHAFFSLSLGMGVMMTYGSYIRKKENLMTTTLQVGAADTVIALIAGLAIFPAVFAFGIEPSAGPGLVFITLPNVFMQMTGGAFFAVMFFALLAVAALTSAISILEVIVAFLDEEYGWSRTKSTVTVAIVITLFGAILSQGNGLLNALQWPFWKGGEWHSMNIFDWFIELVDILLPIGGLLIAIFAGWKLTIFDLREELSNQGDLPVRYLVAYRIVLKIITPLAIAFVLLAALFG